MKTSTEIASTARIVGEEKAVELIAQAGFDAWDFSMFGLCKFERNPRGAYQSDHPLSGSDYLSHARKLKNIGLDCGIVCNQSHAPFPSIYPEGELYLKRAIECTAEAGGSICVIHPENSVSREANIAVCLISFFRFCVFGVCQGNPTGLFEDIEHRYPELTGGFHANIGTVVFGKPFSQLL